MVVVSQHALLLGQVARVWIYCSHAGEQQSGNAVRESKVRIVPSALYAVSRAMMLCSGQLEGREEKGSTGVRKSGSKPALHGTWWSWN